MSALDELRESVIAYLDSEKDECSRKANVADQRVHIAIIACGVSNAIDAFEAAHPGLVDETVICEECGKPVASVRAIGRPWILGGKRVGTSTVYACPDCAKEAS